MNAVGKTLVIFILLFALATGGFIAIHFSTSQNWAKAYKSLKEEMDVAGIHSKTGNETMAKTTRLYKQAKADLEAAQTTITENDLKFKADLAGAQLLLDVEKKKVDDANLNKRLAQEERGRLQEEVKGLLATLKKREATILVLEDDVKKYRTEAIANKNIADSTRDRNEQLLNQIADLNRTLARMSAGSSDTAKDPNAPNPPSAYVKGQIEKIDNSDNGLVRLSIGSDHGINKGHTLEVYRLTPRPEYLGMIRIVEADHHQSVARLVRNGFGSRSPLREGDVVASTIGR